MVVLATMLEQQPFVGPTASAGPRSPSVAAHLPVNPRPRLLERRNAFMDVGNLVEGILQLAVT